MSGAPRGVWAVAAVLAMMGDAVRGHAQPPVIDSLVAQANAEGLPGDVLRAKALEGASRGVSSERIAQVVVAYAGALRLARSILAESGETPALREELVAVAQALTAGVSRSAAGTLATAAHARTAAPPVTVPFVVTVDLVARGVPADSAAVGVQVAVRRGASDAELSRLREAIARDIGDGVPPLDAAMVRSGADPARPARPPATSMPPVPP